MHVQAAQDGHMETIRVLAKYNANLDQVRTRDNTRPVLMAAYVTYVTTNMLHCCIHVRAAAPASPDSTLHPQSCVAAVLQRYGAVVIVVGIVRRICTPTSLRKLRLEESDER